MRFYGSGTRAHQLCCAAGLAAGLSLVACDGTGSTVSDETATVARGDLAYIDGTPLWDINNNVVPVCWMTPGWTLEKTWVRNSVEREWGRAANLTFTGWSDCPTTGTAKYVTIQIDPHDNPRSAGGNTWGLGMDTLRAPGQGFGVHLYFSADHEVYQGRAEYIGVHEFGHVLGFLHEQDRHDAPMPGAPNYCTNAVASQNLINLTAYDDQSIMNYCNGWGNNEGRLSLLDVVGIRSFYGGPAMDWGDADLRWFADLDGDGAPDYCRGTRDAAGSGGTISCSLGTLSGVVRGTPDWSIHLADLGWSGRRWMADVNNDKKADFCRTVGAASGPGSYIACSLSNGAGFGPDQLTAVADWGNDGLRWLADVNQDGRADLCRQSAVDGSRMICTFASTSQAGTFSTGNDISTVVSDWGYPDRHWFVDVDGDQRADYCRAVGDINTGYLGCSLSTSTSVGGAAMKLSPIADWGYSDRRYMVDVNGDGRADFCRATGNASGPGSNLDCLVMNVSGGLLSSQVKRLLPNDWGYADRRWVATIGSRGSFCRALGDSSGPGSFMGCQTIF